MKLSRKAFNVTIHALAQHHSDETRRYLAFHKQRYWSTLIFLRSLLSRSQKKQMRIVEVGPGDYFFGSLVTAFFPQVDTYEGIEPLGSETTTVTKALPHSDFCTHYADLESESDLNATYDMVLCLDVIEHLDRDPSRFLFNLYTLCQSDGKMLITTDNVSRMVSILKLLAEINVWFPIRSRRGLGHKREYTFSEMKDLLLGTGFCIEKATRFNWTPTLPNSKMGTLAYSCVNAVTRVPPLTRYQRHLLFACRPSGTPMLYYPDWLYKTSLEG